MIKLIEKPRIVSKCSHCKEDITSIHRYKIYRDEEGGKHYIHDDPILKRDCLSTSGIDPVMTEYPKPQF